MRIICILFGIFICFGYNIIMKYDVVIIGAGPAGLSAGIFTARAGLKTLCLEKLATGGQAALSYEVANYPGFESISGWDLMQKMQQQATSCGMELEFAQVVKLTKLTSSFKIETKQQTYLAKKVIVACGAKARKLGLENELELTGKGVSYCASCDGNFFKNKAVAVVGGGNTAMEDVEYLSKIASKVYLINRSETFRADQVTVNAVKKMKNVKIITSSVVTKLIGERNLTGIEMSIANKKRMLAVDGLFVAIGYEPDLEFMKIKIEKDSAGYIVVDKNMQTNVKNLFACGDIISKDFKQIITACADGAVAGNSCVGEK